MAQKAQKIHFSVVRNAGYTRGGFTVRERHNERKNEEYGNGDICQDREHLNVHFRQNFKADGTTETYCETYDRLLAAGEISEKWAKPNQKVFAEFVFDVNTDYFEKNGGYEYAKKFYEEAYRLAVKEVGDEKYILSAVLHADEKNSALSKELGRDVYHYHLHVVYVPVVEKREYFRKKKGEPEGAERKLKAVYQQVSLSKKYPIKCTALRDGAMITLNSYSLLQDRYHDHMKAAGFDGFERGEFGSTREHLETTAYKIQQEEKRLAELTAAANEQQKALDSLEIRAGKKEQQIEKLDAAITVKEKAKATIAEIDAMGHTLPLFPGTHFTVDETVRLKKLAKTTAATQEQLAKTTAQAKHQKEEFEKQHAALERRVADLSAEVNHWHREYTDLWSEVKHYIQGIRKFPERFKALVAELFPPKVEPQQEQPIQQQTKKKSYDRGR
jgi:hypothetical protein